MNRDWREIRIRELTKPLAIAAAVLLLLATIVVFAVDGDNENDVGAGSVNRDRGATPSTVAGSDSLTLDVATDDESQSAPSDFELDAPSAFSGNSGGSGSAGGRDSAATTATTAPSASAGSGSSVAAEPLHVAEAGWAQEETSSWGWVPPNGMPVASQGGQTDRISFFRLDGRGTELTLRVLSRDHGPLNDSIRVKACPIVDETWKAANGRQMRNAPAYDASTCVVAKRGDKSRFYTLDLSSFGNPASGNGFMLLPDVPGATTQIVFDRKPFTAPES